MISFCVLGSGSSGNSTLLLLHGSLRRCMLLDAGLSPRETARRLGPLGLRLADLEEVLLTHVDADHLHPGWPELQRRLGLRWRLHRRHVHVARRAGLPVRALEPLDGAVTLGPRTRVEPTLLPHDQLGSTGYVVEHGGARLGYATDFGRVTDALRFAFAGLAALAIESNYDPPMQLASDRPPMLKRRIMGGLGHLSNEQALRAALLCASSGDLQHLVLLHLSRHCNDPRLVRRLYAHRAPQLMGRLTVTHQRAPTPLLHVAAGAGASALAGGFGRQLDFDYL